MRSLDQRVRLGIRTLLFCLVLSGCGGEDGSSGSDPTAPPYVALSEVTLVSQTAGGGEGVGPVVQRLATDAELDAFVTEFEPTFALMIREEARLVVVPETGVLAGGVAYIGCGTPEEVAVVEGPRGLELEPGPTYDEGVDCIAPVTTVGLVAVPAPALR
jgi:hypothetical protein